LSSFLFSFFVLLLVLLVLLRGKRVVGVGLLVQPLPRREEPRVANDYGWLCQPNRVRLVVAREVFEPPPPAALVVERLVAYFNIFGAVSGVIVMACMISLNFESL